MRAREGEHARAHPHAPSVHLLTWQETAGGEARAAAIRDAILQGNTVIPRTVKTSDESWVTDLRHFPRQ